MPVNYNYKYYLEGIFVSIAILRNIPFFADLEEHILLQVWDSGTKTEYPATTVVLREGELAEHFYVILEGTVSVQKSDAGGQRIEIVQLSMGDFFGELALLDAGTRSATVVCISDCRFFTLDQTAFISLLANSAPLAILELMAVITHRVRATSERFFQEELSKQKLEADMQIERHRALAQMVAGVAHEINTPLGIINTAADLINKRLHSGNLHTFVGEDRKAKNALGDIEEAAQLITGNIQRAHKLVQDFKKISVNQVTDSLETVKLMDLIQSSVDLFKLNARKAHLLIEIDSVLPQDATWQGYPASMTQILLNLLSNIERYAYDTNGGKVHVELSAPQAQTFRLVVRDEGHGIAPENLPNIFEPFFTTGRSKGGTGLGMAIVYNLVTEMFGGTIHIESTVGQGTSVNIDFPCHAPQHNPM
jgi:signal transduction histidine kinase